MSQGAFVILLVVVAGALTALQAPTNALLARAVGSPINAALVSFAVGTLVLVAAAALGGVRPDAAAARALPWYAWAGGAYGAVFVAAAAYAVPRVGVGTTLTVLVASQLAAAVLLDHLGAFGVAQRPAGATRLFGLLLVAVGAALVRRG